ncbi:MAG TPA: gephyrin-like molybdotransferase Glp [Planktothrix sp.]|jgi:molybdopterin molybdotransferase
MLTYDEALALILANSHPLPVVERPLSAILGHVLAEPLKTSFPLPLFDNSAVDGYGVRLADTKNASPESPQTLRLIGEIQAGGRAELALEPGSAMKIMTGGLVPRSVDAVVMREYCSEQNGSVAVGYAPEQGENVRYKGAEMGAGEEVLPAGQRVTPPVVGMLATLGYAAYKVHAKPTVAIVATGDELVQPGKTLQAGQIYDSNSFALDAAVRALGVETTAILHARDTREQTHKAFAEALAKSDVVISAGGVSVGDYDHVKDVLEQELGAKTIFWRVKIKPGKPVYFGAVGEKLVFALPGNPVSALITYHLFVKPALLKLIGVPEPEVERLPAVLKAPLRKKAGRLDFVRALTVRASDNTLALTATRGQDSHMLSGLAKANSLIRFAADDEFMPEGTSTLVDMLRWSE